MKFFNELGITGSLIANLIWFIGVALLICFRKSLQIKFGNNITLFFNNLIFNKSYFAISSLFLIFTNAILYCLDYIKSIVFIDVTYLVFIWFGISQLNAAGVFGADAKIKEGLDYEGLLKLVKNDFKFLGTGARKLTDNKDEFKKAIGKVNSAGKIAKFILCDENSLALEKLAQQANIRINEYKHNVRNSREYLEDLVKNGFQIEIRKYKVDDINKMPIFRLTLINGNFAIVSYSLFNDPAHKGEDLSQVHLGDSKNERGYSVSLYHGFDKYFDNLWDQLGE